MVTSLTLRVTRFARLGVPTLLDDEIMEPARAVDLGREAIVTALMVGAPVLLAGVVIGLIIGLLQALTQVQDQTVSFVPKIVAMVAVLALCLPWLIQIMTDYSHDLIVNIPKIISGG